MTLTLSPRQRLLILAFAITTQASAQTLSTKPVRLVLPSPPGGGLDLVARLVAQKSSEGLGTAVIIENRPGADGAIAAELVARAAPDGNTLLMANASTHTSNFYLMRNLRYHPVRDFTPIVGGVESVTCLVASSSLGLGSLKELIDRAKREPGKLNYSSIGATGAYTISMEAFKALSGVDIVHVPYKGLPQAMTAVVSAEVGLTVTSMTVALPQAKAGKIRILGVVEGRPYALQPGVPPIAQILPGYKGAVIWNGFVGPAGTPAAIVNRLNAEFLRALQLPETRAQLEATEIIGGTPQEFGAYIANELEQFGKLVKLLGLKAE
jgi:tripartite-type tricarboxylate transporter receptor subunit TctC